MKIPALAHKKILPLALTLLALSLLPGCQVWNAWLDMPKWRMAETPKKTEGTRVLSENTGPLTSPTTPSANSPRVVLYRITAPVGTFSTNEKVWTELNEDALDSKTSVLMAQNGLRAGIGPVTRWPVIAKLIEGAGITTDQILCQTDGRSSVSVLTRPTITDEIVVSIDRDLQQQGRTFENCDNGFKLSLRTLNAKSQILVQLEPIVTLGTINVTRSQPSVGITRTGFTSEEAFTDLQMAAPLKTDQFLLLAPVDPKSNKFSVGTLWLSDTNKVPPLETILVFVPAANVK